VDQNKKLLKERNWTSHGSVNQKKTPPPRWSHSLLQLLIHLLLEMCRRCILWMWKLLKSLSKSTVSFQFL